MGRQITLGAADGHDFTAWESGDGPRGLIVVQEIFGLNGHIRNTADRLAARGFTAIAPALFDRIGPGLELGYAPDDVTRGRELRAQVTNAQALADIAACAAALTARGLPTGIVGYCWGGSLAWAAATAPVAGISAAVGYYGGEIAKTATATPHCPVMLHFGETDHAIPMTDVETVRRAQPGMPVHTYPAGHGFSCDERGSFDAASHETALARTLEFLSTHLPA